MCIISGTTPFFETDIDPAEAETWRSRSLTERLSSRYREKLKTAGYEFGQSVMNVIHCPCCPTGAKPNPERLATKRELERLFGDDEDGLASAFEDYRL